MIRRHATVLRVTLAAVDFLAAVAVFIGVSVVRFGPAWHEAWHAAAADPWALAVSYGAGWVAILWLLGLYRLRARWSWRTEWTDLLRAILLIAFLTFAALFVAKLPNVSRLFLVGLFLVQAVVAVASRGLMRFLFARARESGRNTRYILVVGDGPVAHDFARRVERNAYLGLRVAGFLADPGPDDPRPGSNPPVDDIQPTRAPAPAGTLGRIDHIETVLRANVIDEVAICLPPESGAFVEPVARLCEEEGLVVRVPLVDGATAIPGGRLEDFEGIRLQSLVYGPDRTLGLIAKRLVDIVGGITGLVLLSPLIVAAAVAIRADSRGPVFFRQVRVGLRGRPFRVFKFRTMVPRRGGASRRVAAVERDQGPRLQGHERPAGHASRGRAAPDEHRRDPPVLERRARRDEPGWAAPAPARGGRRLRHLAPPTAGDEARRDRPLAGRPPAASRTSTAGSGSTSTTSTAGRYGSTSRSSCGRCRRSSRGADGGSGR